VMKRGGNHGMHETPILAAMQQDSAHPLFRSP
jgi:hypothetical protein